MPPGQPRKPRLSLTKSQLQTGVGAELLALCQAVTEDGVLSKEEIVALRRWLTVNRAADLPAVAFLVATVERIIADGKVTRDEVQDLYAAIEAVLPPEARKQAVSARRAAEAEERAQEIAEREEEKRQAREERERNRPVASANFMVAGVHYEGRPAVIRRHVGGGETVYLVRDHGNRFSRNAVEVRLANGMQIGFVPEAEAVDLAPLLDRGCPHRASVTKVLTGGRVPVPVVQAYLHDPAATVEGLVSAASVPPKQHTPVQDDEEEEDESPWERVAREESPKAGRRAAVLLVAGLGAVAAVALVLASFGGKPADPAATHHPDPPAQTAAPTPKPTPHLGFLGQWVRSGDVRVLIDHAAVGYPVLSDLKDGEHRGPHSLMVWYGVENLSPKTLAYRRPARVAAVDDKGRPVEYRSGPALVVKGDVGMADVPPGKPHVDDVLLLAPPADDSEYIDLTFPAVARETSGEFAFRITHWEGKPYRPAPAGSPEPKPDPPQASAAPSPPTLTSPTSSSPAPANPSPSMSGDRSVYVHGYYRKDGTYVKPHYRSRPRR